MKPKISILTPSYNKPEYVTEAINSVLTQTFTDFEYWIIDNSTDQVTRPLLRRFTKSDSRIKYLEFDFSQEARAITYIPAHIFNQFLTNVDTPYFYYLSDDDLIYPTCLETAFSFMESSELKPQVCYFSLEILYWRTDHWSKENTIAVSGTLGNNTRHNSVDCVIDGGQVLAKTSCLELLDYPYAPEDLKEASHSDGLFLNRLAQHFTFHPVGTNEPLMAHRCTPKSTWSKP